MKQNHSPAADSCCPPKKKRQIDFLLWGCLSATGLFYFLQLFFASSIEKIAVIASFSHSVFDLINTMWWGILLGMITVGILSKVPREFVISLLGKGGTFAGVLRATFGGLLLDMCSHGILMVGSKLYERGASTGQVMAFLIASPWNSLSLTIILVALIGLKWTVLFVFLSALIAFISGTLFDQLVKKKILPANPNTVQLPEGFNFMSEAKKSLAQTKYTPKLFLEIAKNGVFDSLMVIRWILFGVLLASLVRSALSAENFHHFFGPTLAGLGLTLFVTTILEVCSEGSAPLAADLLTRANAPGNSFTFLMAGVATDYTEVMVIKETTRSWKIALFLPLVTVPQVVFLGWLMNRFTL